MITRKKAEELKEKAYKMLQKAGIVITEEEYKNMEVVDHGLNEPEKYGVQIIVYVNNERYCAKEMVLIPGQTVCEHKHPPISITNPGKQETFRCRYGEVYLYVPGIPAKKPKAKLPEDREKYFTVWNEIILKPGQQYTILPNTLHWFQAGKEGAIVSEFSSQSLDETDIFTDPDVKRITEIAEND
ncbi:MAG TPA: D-lyxose/D-mannose family sugar isomerase [Candidatus Ratteibacteria bacterium]|nr:D-lyxose/D-mannose family sugar isomerase [Candidatus Ratteibacteria bacterium]